MRIGLNLLHASKDIGGGWNYIANIVHAIDCYDRDNTYIAYVSDSGLPLLNGTSHITAKYIPLNTLNRFKRILYEQTILHVHSLVDNIDVMYWFGNTISLINILPSVATIHDLLVHMGDDDAYPLLKKLYVKLFINNSIKRSSVIAPISEKTSTDVKAYYGVSDARIVVVPNPLSHSFQPTTGNSLYHFRINRQLPERYWLYVSHCYTHKNHERLFQAYSQLCSELGEYTWPLVLCGDKKGYDHYIDNMLKTYNIKHVAMWLSDLSDEEMPLLYSAATALVFPSWYEGGGIPVMEAMACGCPVIASNIPTTIEFAGDSAYLFDPFDSHDIYRAMKEFQQNPELRNACKEKGLKRCNFLRPEHVVARIQDAYIKATINKRFSKSAICHRTGQG